MNWNDITLEKYLQLESIEKDTLDVLDKNSAIISVVFDKEYTSELPLTEYQTLTHRLRFLSQPIPTVEMKKQYGDLVLDKNLANVTLAQYIDFKNFTLHNDIAGCLSCFLIPRGKRYLEGYDVEDVKHYVNQMPITDVLAIQNFFLQYLKRYTVLSLIYLHQRTKRSLRRAKLKGLLRKLTIMKPKHTR